MSLWQEPVLVGVLVASKKSVTAKRHVLSLFRPMDRFPFVPVNNNRRRRRRRRRASRFISKISIVSVVPASWIVRYAKKKERKSPRLEVYCTAPDWTDCDPSPRARNNTNIQIWSYERSQLQLFPILEAESERPHASIDSCNDSTVFLIPGKNELRF